jgi:hypothetical protein
MKTKKKHPKLSPKTTSTPTPHEQLRKPVLRFTPYAWAKLQFFCHRGDTEIGGFGVTPPEDLLLIEDFVTVKQSTSIVSVSFDDGAVADYFEAQVDLGRKPEQFGRLWCHTHPGNSPHPSGLDEETFTRVFGMCQWAVMFILARDGDTYARLRFNVGPKSQSVIPVRIDYGRPFSGSNPDAWEEEYQANIHPEPDLANVKVDRPLAAFGADDPWDTWLDLLDPEEVEQLSMNELDELLRNEVI